MHAHAHARNNSLIFSQHTKATALHYTVETNARLLITSGQLQSRKAEAIRVPAAIITQQNATHFPLFALPSLQPTAAETINRTEEWCLVSVSQCAEPQTQVTYCSLAGLQVYRSRDLMLQCYV